MLKMAWLVAYVFATPAFALDPEKAITQFVHTSWTEKDGAPAGIKALAQTADGYLWIGTQAGLFHFDGVRFVRFEPPAGESLPSARIHRLFATRDGALWICSGVGAWSRLFNGHLSEPEKLPPTYRLVECKDGALLAGTEKGLTRLKDGIWKDVGKEWNFPGKQAREIYFDRGGTLWVLTEDRVVYLPPGQSRFIDPGEPATWGDFAEAPDGAIWISESSRSAHTVRRAEDSGPVTEVRVGATWVLFDRNGSLWIASGGDGLRRVAYPGRIEGHSIAQFGPQAEQFTAKDGLSGALVATMLEDREGNIWTGTLKGLDRFRESFVTPVPVSQPDVPRFFQPARDGGVWVAALNPVGVLRIGPRGDREVVTARSVNTMCEDETGVIFGGPAGVARFQQGRFVQLPLPRDVVGEDLWSMASDRAGGIWLFNVGKGLFRFANGVLTRVADQLELAPRLGYLYTDRRGRIWLGQTNRVAVYDRGKFQVFGASDGVPPGLVLTFHEDRAGNPWVGGDGGLARFENGRFRALSTSNGFPTRSVFGLAEDDDGYWWIAIDTGVLRIAGRELDRAITDPAYRVRYESFGLLDGLPGRPRQADPLPIVARTTDGRIWFATNNGIAYVDPRRRMPKNNLAPPVKVETVKIDGKELAPADKMALSHRTNDIEIDYTALSLSIPERVLFRYKLEGKEVEWHDVGTRRQAYYNSLAPKEYRFRVMACNNDGVWNEEGASWGFSIVPAFYQTSWFQSLYVLAGAGLMWLLYRFRLKQMTAKVKLRYTERLAERTRIARDLHDTLLQSLAGVSLQLDGISKQVPAASEKAALIGLREQVDSCFREARVKVWDLRSPALEGQGLAAALREFVERVGPSSAARCCFTVSGEPRPCAPEVEEELLRIAQEAANNANRHAQANEIRVALEYGASSLTLSISDDGKGFDFEEGLRKTGHWGLKNMQERAAQIRGTCRITTAAGKGTQIEIRVPLSFAM
jgi:signal transduction histidine kinase/ligand-binding sensor domain-containing protein